MGGATSRKKSRKEVFQVLAAVASSLRLGWFGTRDLRAEMHAFQQALFPHLVNTSAAQDDNCAMEDHVEEGADILCADAKGRTPLHIAAAHGNENTVRTLLTLGVDVNAIDCIGETALENAIRSGSLEVMEWLITVGAHLERSSEELGAEMCCLAFIGDTVQMRAWKKAGVSFNTSDAQGRTPLHVAVCANLSEMVKFCILNGSDPKQRDKMNNSPIDDALRLGFKHMMELLPESEEPEQ